MNLLNKRFDYSYSVSHRLEIPNQFIQIKNKKIKLELLVTNGFVKIYTYKGRIYGIKQNIDQHTIPDWKIHFNVTSEDISKSFNIISETFIKHIINNTKEEDIIDDLIIAIKAYNINLAVKIQKGREITLYIYTFNEKLNDQLEEFEVEDEKGDKQKVAYIFRKNEERNFKFYYDLLIDIEQQLNNMKIKKTIKNGAADGDLWLGKYSSLRNESYCKDKNGDLVYPPNDKGFNSAKQKMPFSWYQIFMIRYALVYKESKFSFFIIPFIFLIISIIYIIFKNLF
jgi:hypothetical protein